MYINKLKRKFIKSGFKSLEKQEILEFLLYYISKKDVKKNQELAMELLQRYKSIYRLTKAPFYKYIKSTLINEEMYIFFRLLNELIESEILYEKIISEKKITCAKDVAAYLRYNMSSYEREIFKIIYLTTQNTIIKDEILFYGTIDQSSVYIREIIKRIIYYNAKSIIIAHNHPSGSLKPSQSDIEITNNISSAIKYIDASLLDHIIVSENGYYSFLEGDLI